MTIDQAKAGEKEKTKHRFGNSNQRVLQKTSRNRNQHVPAQSLLEKKLQHRMSHKSMTCGSFER